MRIIDAHVHLYPAEVNRDPAGWARARGELDWAGLCTRRRKNGDAVQGFPSLDELLREMDRAGVARAVLLGWYWAQPETCAWQNRFYAACVRAHPDRLSAFATVQPKAGGATVRAEIKRAQAEGLLGLGELSPHAQRHAFDDPGWQAALALCAEIHWPVALHVTDPNTREYPGRVATPLEDFVHLAGEHPEVNFILAHWGGLLPLRDPAAARISNLYYDSAASPLMYDDSIWQRFLAVVPAERVVLGSDFPLNVYPRLEREPTMTRLIGEAMEAGVPDVVMSGNITRLLGC